MNEQILKEQFDSWKKKADEGTDPEAQYKVSCMYSEGKGVEKNENLEKYYCFLAANQGHVRAQFKMGIYCEQEDMTAAAKWYRKAKKQGNVYAQNNLGVLFFHGDGVKKNEQKAAKLFRKTGDSGLSEGDYNLGVCWEHGKGVERNKTRASYRYWKAAQQGHDQAAEAYNKLLPEVWLNFRKK